MCSIQIEFGACNVYMDCNDILASIADWLGPSEFAAFARVNRRCAAICKRLAESKKHTFVMNMWRYDNAYFGVLMANRKVMHGHFKGRYYVSNGASCYILEIQASHVLGTLHGRCVIEYWSVAGTSVFAYDDYEHGVLVRRTGELAKMFDMLEAYRCPSCKNQTFIDCILCGDECRPRGTYVFSSN